jgi:hypothetical protein
MSAPAWLTTLGIPEGCIARKSSAEEHTRRFSIRSQPGDIVWRVKVDEGWLQSGGDKRVDYLFWGQSASGRKVILLVELKGENFGKALLQIESTLDRLCKRADGNGIHIGPHLHSPGHALLAEGGVRAYVVLSKGKGVPLRLKEQELLRKRYGVFVRTGERHLDVKGIDAVF